MKKTILILTALLFFSCGTRKTELNKSEKKVDTEVKATEIETKQTDQKETLKGSVEKESEQKENAKVEENKNVETKSTTTTTNIKPIDNTKPSKVKDSKGRVWELTNAELNEIISDATTKDNSKIISQYENELKEREKSEFNYLNTIKTLSAKNKDLEYKNKVLEDYKNKNTQKTNNWSLFILGLCLGITIVIMIWVGYVQRKKLFV